MKGTGGIPGGLLGLGTNKARQYGYLARKPVIFTPTPELENHIKYIDLTVPRNRGIGGAHDKTEFFKNDVKIVGATPSKDISGITRYDYTMPLLGKDGKPIGGYGVSVFHKTVYDPKKISYNKYVKRGLEAANNVYNAKGSLGSYWVGYDSHGVKWIGFAEKGQPTSFFPDIPD